MYNGQVPINLGYMHIILISRHISLKIAWKFK
jgi:hypothetical protein